MIVAAATMSFVFEGESPEAIDAALSRLRRSMERWAKATGVELHGGPILVHAIQPTNHEPSPEGEVNLDEAGRLFEP